MYCIILNIVLYLHHERRKNLYTDEEGGFGDVHFIGDLQIRGLHFRYYQGSA